MNKNKISIVSVSCLPLVLTPTSAFAYIGPGIGGGVIAVIIGVFSAIFLTLASILYFPIKRMLRRTKADETTAIEEAPPANSEESTK